MYHTTAPLCLSFHNTSKSVKLAHNSDLVSSSNSRHISILTAVTKKMIITKVKDGGCRFFYMFVKLYHTTRRHILDDSE
jgi:hypothetical protein